jgi:hypothetical protein
MVGLVLALSGVVFTCVVMKIITPVSIMRHQREEIALLETRQKQLTADRVENERLAQYLSKAEGRELQVRHLGWVKPGERALRLNDSSWPGATGSGSAMPSDKQR